MEIPKPPSLSEKEWGEIQLAHRTGYFRYVFKAPWLWWGLVAMLIGVWIDEWLRANGDMGAAVDAVLHGQVVRGMVFFTLSFVIGRSIEWFGKRKTAKTAGL